MPKRFIFHIDLEHHFAANLKSDQCSANCKNGNRCRKRVIIGLPYCYVHLLSVMHLRIKPSTVVNAGLGLFASDPKAGENDIIFNKGDVIAKYTGELINKAELEHRYGDNTAPYALEISKDKYIDAATERGAMSLANHTSSKSANASFQNPNYRNNSVTVKAVKNIKNNTEILINYGNKYRFNDAEFETKNVRS
jgi:hypothetical protein